LHDIDSSRPPDTTVTSIAATQNCVYGAVTSHFNLERNISGSETMPEKANEQATWYMLNGKEG
jgi:hypothetical protein